MKILHTADWHLGRSLGAFDLLEFQRQSLDSLIDIAKDEKPDAIVIAGDLYDRSIPSEAAMATFQQAIVALREIAPVIAIAGNHDGAGRVGHFACLLRDRGIHLAATEYGELPKVVLADRHGEVHFHLMPFALPHEIRHALSSRDDASPITSHQTAIAARLATVERTTGARHVLVGHLFTQAGDEIQESESERDISVGGSSAVLPSTFDGFNYVALGHLHKPHDVVAGRIRYAGSLGRYSFSEETHEKSASIVELDPSGLASIRTVPLRQAMDMRTLRGLFADVLRSAASDTAKESTFVRVELLDPIPQFEAFRRLAEQYPFLCGVTYRHEPAMAGQSQPTAAAERRNPLEMLRAYCRDRLGASEISQDAMRLASDLMEKARLLP
jgi:exonuclease SbcD